MIHLQNLSNKLKIKCDDCKSDDDFLDSLKESGELCEFVKEIFSVPDNQEWRSSHSPLIGKLVTRLCDTLSKDPVENNVVEVADLLNEMLTTQGIFKIVQNTHDIERLAQIGKVTNENLESRVNNHGKRPIWRSPKMDHLAVIENGPPGGHSK